MNISQLFFHTSANCDGNGREVEVVRGQVFLRGRHDSRSQRGARALQRRRFRQETRRDFPQVSHFLFKLSRKETIAY